MQGEKDTVKLSHAQLLIFLNHDFHVGLVEYVGQCGFDSVWGINTRIDVSVCVKRHTHEHKPGSSDSRLG